MNHKQTVDSSIKTRNRNVDNSAEDKNNTVTSEADQDSNSSVSESASSETSIYDIIIVKEKDNELYKVSGRLDYSVDIINDEEFSISGILTTNYFIGETDIDFFETWRYKVLGAQIKKISCSSKEENIIYTFTADSFEIKG